jgi:hypothetical protein
MAHLVEDGIEIISDDVGRDAEIGADFAVLQSLRDESSDDALLLAKATRAMHDGLAGCHAISPESGQRPRAAKT